MRHAVDEGLMYQGTGEDAVSRRTEIRKSLLVLGDIATNRGNDRQQIGDGRTNLRLTLRLHRTRGMRVSCHEFTIRCFCSISLVYDGVTEIFLIKM